MKCFDLMIDIECAGKDNDAALMGLGAVFFDIATETIGATFNKHIHLATSVRDGGTMDPSTILWWFGQSDEVRKAARFSTEDIRKVLPEFSEWVAANCRVEDVRVWGNSARFDLGKIESAYKRMGLSVPWYWTQERCFRTVRNQYPSVVYDPSEKTGTAHDPLVDAMFQVQHLFKIKNRNKKVPT